jgi:hypothetical protein
MEDRTTLATNAHQCPECGAPVAPHTKQCAYCGSWLEDHSGHIPIESIEAKAPPPRQLPDLKLSPGVAEFGFSGQLPLALAFVGGLGIYFTGWLFEDLAYWLEDKAVFIWVVILPLWLFLTALSWQTDRRAWTAGLVLAIPIFAMHIFVIWLVRGRLNDDHFGIAAMVAGTSLLSWILGRVLHHGIRWRTMRSTED